MHNSDDSVAQTATKMCDQKMHSFIQSYHLARCLATLTEPHHGRFRTDWRWSPQPITRLLSAFLSKTGHSVM